MPQRPAQEATGRGQSLRGGGAETCGENSFGRSRAWQEVGSDEGNYLGVVLRFPALGANCSSTWRTSKSTGTTYCTEMFTEFPAFRTATWRSSNGIPKSRAPC